MPFPTAEQQDPMLPLTTEVDEQSPAIQARVLESMIEGVIVVDEQGIIRLTNPAMDAMFGYARSELVGKHVSIVNAYPPEASARVATDVIANVLAHGTYFGEFHNRKKDGTEFYSSARITRVDMSGTTWLISVQHDITDRKRAESALREAHDELEARVQQRTAELSRANALLIEEIAHRQHIEDELRRSNDTLRALIHASPLAIITLDTVGKVRLWSPGATRIFGWSEQEVIGQPLPIVPTDRHAEFQELLASACAGNVHAGVELQRRRKDGAAIDVSLWTAPLHDGRGEIAGAAGIYADISERKRAQREFEELTHRVLNILDSITEAFWAADAQSRFTYLNRSAENLLRRRREELIGKSIWDVFPKAITSQFADQYRTVVSEGVPAVTDAYYPAVNRWLKVRFYPFQGGASVLIEDITERHASEITVVSDILRALNAHLNVQEAFQDVAASLRTLTGCDRSSLAMLDAKMEWLEVLALDHERPDAPPGSRFRSADIPASGQVLQGEPYILPDLGVALSSPVAQYLYQIGIRSAVCLPLRGTARVLGMLSLTWQRYGGGNAAQIPVLTQIADALALAVEKNQLFEQVRSTGQQLENLSRRLMEIQEVERRHLARELHDEIGQGLAGLKLLLDTFERLPADNGRARLSELQTLVQNMLMQVRNLSLDLRPAMLDDLGLLPALLWLFGRYSAQTNVHVTFEHSGVDARFPPAVETAAYRIVQEALTNVARHAGVQEVAVHALAAGDALTLCVKDAGVGFDPTSALVQRTNTGLAGMRERALLLGGHFALESAPGAGTQVCVDLPVRTHAPEEADADHAAAGR